ncbi:MAG: prepilin-type cleavage/methylation domain-containing protein [Bdellovibrio sp.]|nr:MAG: prepilin-type cleavage/methylation domain-containing protein [Bdellovibrio sp.]
MRICNNTPLTGSAGNTDLVCGGAERTDLGFSLLEILIVVAIIAGLMAALIPRAFRPDNGFKKVSHHLMVLVRDIRNQARIKNRTYRLVFQMEGDKHGYWVESAPGQVAPKTVLTMQEEARLPDEEKPREVFDKDPKYTKKEFEMPKGLYFALVETPALGEGVSQGFAYVYFSPEGLVEPAAIQFTDRKNLNSTLIINPLTGHSDLVDKAVRLNDIKSD